MAESVVFQPPVEKKKSDELCTSCGQARHIVLNELGICELCVHTEMLDLQRHIVARLDRFSKFLHPENPSRERVLRMALELLQLEL